MGDFPLPEQIKITHSHTKPPFPIFIYRGGIVSVDDAELFEMIIGQLKAHKLYNKDLLYCGFYGAPFYKAKSFGDRTYTWAVTEEFLRDILNPEVEADVASPVTHMSVMGKRTPSLGVFDKTKLLAGDNISNNGEFEVWDDIVDRNKVVWKTKDGNSINSAAVVVFVFKKPSFDEDYKRAY